VYLCVWRHVVALILMMADRSMLCWRVHTFVSVSVCLYTPVCLEACHGTDLDDGREVHAVLTSTYISVCVCSLCTCVSEGMSWQWAGWWQRGLWCHWRTSHTKSAYPDWGRFPLCLLHHSWSAPLSLCVVIVLLSSLSSSNSSKLVQITSQCSSNLAGTTRQKLCLQLH